MVKTSQALLLGAISVFLGGCVVTKGPDDTFSLVIHSSKQVYAEHDAKTKAEDYCIAHGKSLDVLDHQAQYDNSRKHNKYEVTLKFRCK